MFPLVAALHFDSYRSESAANPDSGPRWITRLRSFHSLSSMIDDSMRSLARVRFAMGHHISAHFTRRTLHGAHARRAQPYQTRVDTATSPSHISPS